MLKTVEAVIEVDGRLRLLEQVTIKGTKRVLVTFLEDDGEGLGEAALLSEAALGEDWNRPEEDEAWQHLADRFAGKTGRVRSAGEGNLSENTGRKFADHLEEKKRAGQL